MGRGRYSHAGLSRWSRQSETLRKKMRNTHADRGGWGCELGEMENKWVTRLLIYDQ